MLINSRLKSKIESIRDYKDFYSIKFKDIDDTFWLNSETDLYDFINRQVSERFYDKELRKGYFDYVNENNDTIRYYIEVNRGNIISYRDEIMK